MSKDLIPIDNEEVQGQTIPIAEESLGFAVPPDAAASMASQASYIIGDNLTDNFFKIKNDLMYAGYSADIDDLLAILEQDEVEANEEALRQELLRDDLTLEEKVQTVDVGTKPTEVSVDTSTLPTEVPVAEKLPEAEPITKKSSFFDFLSSSGNQLSRQMGIEAALDYQEETGYAEDDLTQEQKIKAAYNRNLQMQIDTIKAEAFKGKEGGGWGVLDVTAGGFEMMVPRNYADTVQKLYAYMTGDTSVTEHTFITAVAEPAAFFHGELMHRMKEMFYNLDEQGKLDWARKMTQFFIDGEEDNFPLLRERNGLFMLLTLDALLNTDFDPNEDFDWDRLGENIASAFDLMLAGGHFRWMTKTFANLVENNPKLGGQVGAGIMTADDIAETKAAWGVDKIEVLRNFSLPSLNAEVIKNAPGNLAESLRGLADAATGVLAQHFEPRTSLTAMAQRFAKTYGQGKLHVNKVHEPKAVKGEPNTYQFEVVVARGPEDTFANMGTAWRNAKLRGVADSPDELVFYAHMPSGKIERLGKGQKRAKAKLEQLQKESEIVGSQDPVGFYYGFTRKETMPSPNLFDMTPVERKFFNLFNGKWRRTFTDATGIFGTMGTKLAMLTDSYARAARQSDNIIRDFMKASRETQTGALELLSMGTQPLRDGGKHGRVISWDEALSKGFTEKQYLAYQSLRIASDFSYTIHNARLKELLEEGGNVRFSFKPSNGDKDFTGFGVPVPPSRVREMKTVKNESVTEVYNAHTGKTEAVTEDMLKAAQTGKGMFIRSAKTITVDGKHRNYIYIPEGQVGKRVGEIGSTPLPYIKGHVYIQQDNNWYIKKVATDKVEFDVDGVKTADAGYGDVIAGARSKAEVDLLMETHKLSQAEIDKGWKLEVVESRDTKTMESIEDLMRVGGVQETGVRGAPIDTVSGPNANILSHTDSIINEMHSATRHLNFEAVIKDYRDSWSLTFKKALEDIVNSNVRKTKGSVADRIAVGYPRTIEDLRGMFAGKALTTAQKKVIEDAETAWELIEFMAKNRDSSVELFRRATLSIADALEKATTAQKGGAALQKGIAATGAALRTVGRNMSRDPIDFARSTAFVAYLALNPFRQLIIQSAQHLMMTPLAPGYVTSGEIYKDLGSYSLGLGFRSDPEKWNRNAEWLAKSVGMTTEEFTQEIDGIFKSGILDAVDSHTLLEGLNFASTPTAGMSAGRAKLAQAANVGRSIATLAKSGFVLGERTNLLTSYLIAKKLRANEGLTALATSARGSTIYEETRDITFNMSRGGELKIQRGPLKGLAQFASFQLKAFNAIIGKNPTLKGRRLQVLTGQALMWGSAGYGLQTVVAPLLNEAEDAYGKPLPPELETMLTYGIGAYIANSLIDGLAGEKGVKSEIDFSPLAPFGGANWGAKSIFEFFTNTQRSGIEILFGPSASLWARFDKGIDAMLTIMGKRAPIDPDESEGQRALRAMKALGHEVIPAMSNFSKGSIMRQSGYILDSEGNNLVRSSLAEAYAKQLVGFRSVKEIKYRTLEEYAREKATAFSKDAKLIVNIMHAEYLKNGGKNQGIDFFTETMDSITGIVDTYSEEDRDLMADAITDALRNKSIRLQRDGADNMLEYVLTHSSKYRTISGIENELKSIFGEDETSQKVMQLVVERLNEESDLNMGKVPVDTSAMPSKKQENE